MHKRYLTPFKNTTTRLFTQASKKKSQILEYSTDRDLKSTFFISTTSEQL